MLTLHLKALILAASAQFNFCPYTLAAVMQVESSFNPQAVGPVGEVGLMQLRPEYFEERGDLTDPETNVFLAAEYLASLKRRCVHKSNMTFVVCYNVGPTKARQIVKPTEFKYYVKVMRAYHEIKEAGTFD